MCWGNICRSPIAERVAERVAADTGIDAVAFTSAATSTEELAKPMDRRAAAVLRNTVIAMTITEPTRSPAKRSTARTW